MRIISQLHPSISVAIEGILTAHSGKADPKGPGPTTLILLAAHPGIAEPARIRETFTTPQWSKHESKTSTYTNECAGCVTIDRA